jgi:hypothetical protein
MVQRYLGEPASYPWRKFRADYLRTVMARFKEDPAPFAELARLALETDVYLGCSCPTKKNPNVMHCHTVLALTFMHGRYGEIAVVMPRATE